MKMPKLYARIIRPEGRIEWPEEWNDYHPVRRADILADWIYEMQTAWINAVKATPEAQQKLDYFLKDETVQ